MRDCEISAIPQFRMSAFPPLLLALLGPTAVGKTALSLRLAQQFDGEIVSADSRQIYRGLDIGADKAGPAERVAVPHHLLDVVAPDEILTLAAYQRAAYAAIDDIQQRGRLPLLVGGTGLYVRAVLDGLGIPEAPPNPELRAELGSFAEVHGAQALHARLAAVDPVAAQRIDASNVRRVVRALEVYRVVGQPISALQQATPPSYPILRIGLTRPRAVLYARIDRRVDDMVARGLLDEVRGLLAAGYSPSLPAMTGLGYRQMAQYLQGELSFDQAVAAIKHQTRRLVHQQNTWFRPGDTRIHWFDLEQTTTEQIAVVVREWLEAATAGGEEAHGSHG